MIQLEQMEEGLIESHEDRPFLIEKKVWWPLLTAIPVIVIFLLLWLAESQYSQGVLRTRNDGEECGYGILKNSMCSSGLVCKYGKCEIPKCHNTVYSNRTDPCPRCPSVHPKSVTYFDFNEMPNRWLNPGTRGFFKIFYDFPYGACKEMCALNSECKAISYKGDANMCCFLQDYFLPVIMNHTWNAAIKIV